MWEGYREKEKEGGRESGKSIMEITQGNLESMTQTFHENVEETKSFK